MSINLIGEDIKKLRDSYDEALEMLGIPARYQYPIMAESNAQGEAVVDRYSIPEDVHIFFDGTPKLKTIKRLGWVVENNEDLPFLVHCSFNLQHLQKDSIFHIGGQHAEIGERTFRVTELTTDLQCPDHVTCKVVPVYEKRLVGRTKKEVEKRFSKSNTFLNPDTDYRGQYISEQDGER